MRFVIALLYFLFTSGPLVGWKQMWCMSVMIAGFFVLQGLLRTLIQSMFLFLIHIHRLGRTRLVQSLVLFVGIVISVEFL